MILTGVPRIYIFPPAVMEAEDKENILLTLTLKTIRTLEIPPATA